MNVTSNTSIAPPPTSPFAKMNPPTPLSIARNCHTPLVPTPIETDSQPSSLLLNGNSTAESVTVTHFSEEHRTMAKISVPSMNLFGAESQPNQAAEHNSTNPFLNMTPIASAASTPVTSTNPFRSPNDSDKPAVAIKNTNGMVTTNNSASKIPVPVALNSSIISSNGNNNSNHASEPSTPSPTNPFTMLSEADSGIKTTGMTRQNSIKRTNSKLKKYNNNNVNHFDSKNNNGKPNEESKMKSEVS